MKPFRIQLSAVILMGAAVASGLMLYATSQAVQKAERDLKKYQDAVAFEKEAIRVLEAEWDYLNRPDRIDALVSEIMPEMRDLDHAPGVIDRAAYIPQPLIPGLPKAKPDFEALGYAIPVATQPKRIERPKPGARKEIPLKAKVKPANAFDSLLGRLATQNTGNGGAQ